MYNNISAKIGLFDLDINWVTMPDGLPHLTVKHKIDYLVFKKSITIFAKIKTGDDLIRLEMLKSVLDIEYPGIECDLSIQYMSAERMDRSMNVGSPETLKLWCAHINRMKFSNLFVSCSHSEVVLAYLDRSAALLCNEKGFFDSSIEEFKKLYGAEYISLVIPDMGAYKRFEKLGMIGDDTVICHKLREQSTGKLKGFSILAGMPRQYCLILDDLCDGGGTFAGQAEVLKKNGAKVVGLACFHGIFSKNLPISNIDWVSCTNSFHEEKILSALGVNYVYCN